MKLCQLFAFLHFRVYFLPVFKFGVEFRFLHIYILPGRTAFTNSLYEFLFHGKVPHDSHRGRYFKKKNYRFQRSQLFDIFVGLLVSVMSVCPISMILLSFLIVRVQDYARGCMDMVWSERNTDELTILRFLFYLFV